MAPLKCRKAKGREVADSHNVNLKVTVPYSPWQNLAEASVRECKSMPRRLMRRVHAPKRTWTYAAKWITALRRLTASSIPDLEGRTPTEYVTGSTPDITVYCLFQWYDYVYYHSPDASFPYQKREMGRLLGVADNCTDELAFVILPLSGNLLIRKSVWGIPPETLTTDSVKADMLELDAAIAKRFGDQTLHGRRRDSPDLEELPDPPPDFLEEEDTELAEPLENQDADSYTPESLDEYLGATLLLPHGDGVQRARVLRRQQDPLGKPVGKRHSNPIFDSRMYEVEFPDGSTDVMTTNLIAENLYSQVDKEGETYTVMKEIE